MNTFQRMLTAYNNGISNPYAVWTVSREVGLPFFVLCAFLEQESNGGDNIFGHDRNTDGTPRPFYGAGRVTKKKYLAYKKERLAGNGSQGVGPMQLTWYGFQDRADAAGGCWKARVNMTVGAELLLSYWNTYGDWAKVGQRYNGKASYGQQVADRVQKWRGILNGG